MILDADSLNLLCAKPELAAYCKNSILTPNVVEFERLWNKFYNQEERIKQAIQVDPKLEFQVLQATEPLSEIVKLSKCFNATIIQKGKNDIISDGNQVIQINTQGGFKRVGGQGDILAGALGSFCYYSKCKKMNLIEACVRASILVRTSSRIAYNEFGYSLLCGDVVNAIPSAFKKLLEVSNLSKI